MDLNTFLIEIQPVLTGYAWKRWKNLYTPVEDIVQETLVYIWKNWEEKIKDHENRNAHCCRALDYIALNAYLKEHKEGLWARKIVSDYVSDCQTDRIDCLCDPWLENYYEKRRAYGRERYKKDRERRLEYSRRYYRENKEKCREYSREYYEKNKEKMREYHREYQKEYRQKNREYYQEKREKAREYYQENREKAMEYRREYYEKNKEKVRMSQRRYREKNKEKVLAIEKRYRETHKEEIYARKKRRYDKVKQLRDDVEREYGIRVNWHIASKLFSAKNRSESEFLDMIEKLKAGKPVD